MVSKICSLEEGKFSQGNSWPHAEKATDGIRGENTQEAVVLSLNENTDRQIGGKKGSVCVWLHTQTHLRVNTQFQLIKGRNGHERVHVLRMKTEVVSMTVIGDGISHESFVICPHYQILKTFLT